MTEETKAAIRDCMEIADKHAGGMPISVELRRRFPEAWGPAPTMIATYVSTPYGLSIPVLLLEQEAETMRLVEEAVSPGIPSWDWDKHPEGRQKPKPFPLPMGC